MKVYFIEQSKKMSKLSTNNIFNIAMYYTATSGPEKHDSVFTKDFVKTNILDGFIRNHVGDLVKKSRQSEKKP